MGVLKGIDSFAQSIPSVGAQLFDAFVPLERYTEYQRDYNWEILFPRTVSGVAGLVVSKYCKRVIFGNQNVEKVGQINVGAKKQFVPEDMLIDRVHLTFLAPFPDHVQDYFVKWRDLMLTTRGDYHAQQVYKHSLFVQLYTQQGITSNILHLTGVFPVKVPAYDLAYANEDILKYEITLSVDDLKLKPMDIGGLVKTTIPRVLGSLGKQVLNDPRHGV